MLAVDLVVCSGGQLPINGFGVVEGDRVVGAMFVVARGDGQEGHGSKRGEEGAIAAEQSFIRMVL
jgi:hypothetical protein